MARHVVEIAFSLCLFCGYIVGNKSCRFCHIHSFSCSDYFTSAEEGKQMKKKEAADEGTEEKEESKEIMPSIK